MFKDGTSTYDLIDLVILKDLDFQNREKDEVLELLGEDFEYDLALNAKNYEIPDNFIIIPQNTIITENSGYYVTVTFKETTIGLKRTRILSIILMVDLLRVCLKIQNYFILVGVLHL